MRIGRFGVAAVALTAALLTMEVCCWPGGTPERPKVLGIAYVEFKSTDLEKAKAFYGRELGLVDIERHHPQGGKGSADVIEASFVVNEDQRVELTKVAVGTEGSYLVEIGLATEDLTGMRKYLTGRGVAAGTIVTRRDGSRYFRTTDPEGNKIVFVERKSGAAETGTPVAISHKLIHAGIIVKDATVENRFYADVLGFHAYWHGGMKEGETSWMAMQVPDGTDWIEYMLRIPADADKHTRGVMYHISLGVPSVEAAAKELDKRGFGGFEAPKIGKDGKWQLNLYDPDATRVELMEFTPVEKPCCAEFTGTHPKP
jgi:catechol 2,3-dioxygenase-like lactoylglutathione lyase family enzyme